MTIGLSFRQEVVGIESVRVRVQVVQSVQAVRGDDYRGSLRNGIVSGGEFQVLFNVSRDNRHWRVHPL